MISFEKPILLQALANLPFTTINQKYQFKTNTVFTILFLLFDFNSLFYWFWFLSEGMTSGTPAFTGSPKLGVPSSFQVNFCALGDRSRPQPCPGCEFA